VARLVTGRLQLIAVGRAAVRIMPTDHIVNAKVSICFANFTSNRFYFGKSSIKNLEMLG
jgi:hypothetical protein